MTRQPNILRPIRLETTLPEDIRSRLDLHLWSDLEGRVPKGAYQKFLIERIKEELDSETIDLSDYFGVCPKGRYLIKSNKQSITQLKLLLSRDLI